MAIHIKAANKGKLHSALGVPQGEKIPVSKLEAAKHSKSQAIRKEANFALNARKFSHDSEPDDVIPAGEDCGEATGRQHYDGMMRPNPR